MTYSPYTAKYKISKMNFILWDQQDVSEKLLLSFDFSFRNTGTQLQLKHK